MKKNCYLSRQAIHFPVRFYTIHSLTQCPPNEEAEINVLGEKLSEKKPKIIYNRFKGLIGRELSIVCVNRGCLRWPYPFLPDPAPGRLPVAPEHVPCRE